MSDETRKELEKAIEEIKRHAKTAERIPTGSGNPNAGRPTKIAYSKIKYTDTHRQMIASMLRNPIVVTREHEPDDRYPHRCPRCNGPAYIGAVSVECKGECR